MGESQRRLRKRSPVRDHAGISEIRHEACRFQPVYQRDRHIEKEPRQKTSISKVMEFLSISFTQSQASHLIEEPLGV
jgi:hypothetical protein